MNGIPLSVLAASNSWQANFVSILPAITNHANTRFRRLPGHRREEAIAETIAAACISYQKLAAQGKLTKAYISSLAGFSTRHTAQHRHVGGSQSSSDAMSPLACRKHGFAVRNLGGRQDHYGWAPLLVESRRFSPADAATFKIDFENWVTGFSERHRRIIGTLASGERTTAVAERFGISLARVSELRREYERRWDVFQGEASGQPA